LAYIRRTRLVLYADGTQFKQQQQLIDWLSRFPKDQGFHTIRMLSYLESVESFGARIPGLIDDVPVAITDPLLTHPASFVTRCPGLRSLIIEVRARDMLQVKEKEQRAAGESYWDSHYVSSVETLKTKLRYEGLFKMKKLRHLKVICIDWSYYVTYMSIATDPAHLFSTFVQMITEGFKERGGEINIEVSYGDL
jgi:hypothetical protein